jgi:hypothetical protein
MGILGIVTMVVFGIICSIIAVSKGRNALGWFFAGLLVGPFGLIVAVLKDVERENYTKKCSKCAEVVKHDAVVCRHCGAQLEPAMAAAND